jgi:hypothetical protein
VVDMASLPPAEVDCVPKVFFWPDLDALLRLAPTDRRLEIDTEPADSPLAGLARRVLDLRQQEDPLRLVVVSKAGSRYLGLPDNVTVRVVWRPNIMGLFVPTQVQMLLPVPRSAPQAAVMLKAMAEDAQPANPVEVPLLKELLAVAPLSPELKSMHWRVVFYGFSALYRVAVVTLQNEDAGKPMRLQLAIGKSDAVLVLSDYPLQERAGMASRLPGEVRPPEGTPTMPPGTHP